MKPKFPNFFNASMPRRFCLVGLLALCFILRPITASAQALTQAQIQAAFVDALKEFAEYSSGDDYLILTAPMSDTTQLSLSEFLTVYGNSQNPYNSFATRWDPYITQLLPIWLPLIGNAVTNRAELVQILNAVRALGSVTNQLDALDDIYSILDESAVPEDVATLVKNQVTVDDLQGLLSASSNQLASVIGILRNEENPIEVDIRDSGTAANYLGQIIDALLGGSGGSSVVGVLQGLTNAIAGGEVTPVDVQNFDELAPLFTDFGDELNEKDWRVKVINFDESESDANTVLLRRFQSDFEPYLRSLSSLTNAASLYKRDIESSNQDGPQLYENLTNEVAYSNAQDDIAAGQSITNEILSKMDNEPDMPAYETGDEPTSRFDAQFKSDLIPSGSLNPSGLQHDTRITLISAADFRAGTGVSGEMVYDIFGGNGGSVGSFFSKLDSIVQLGWQGYFAVLSALMFWRYQSKIAKALNTGK